MSDFVLPEVLDLCEAGPLTTRLLEARGNQIVVDASKVQRMGAQCVQVLLSAHATWGRDNMPWAIINPSQAFTDSLETLGISTDTLTKQEATK